MSTAMTDTDYKPWRCQKHQDALDVICHDCSNAARRVTDLQASQKKAAEIAEAMAAHDKKYPQHAKLRALMPKRDAAQEFYDFLHDEMELTLAKYHKHVDGCWEKDPAHVFPPACGFYTNKLYSFDMGPAELIAKFLGIDPKKLEEEKRAMLDEIRKEG